MVQNSKGKGGYTVRSTSQSLSLFRVSFQLFYAYMSIYSLLLHSFYRNSITPQTPNFAVMATLYSLNSKMRRHHFHIHHCKLTT